MNYTFKEFKWMAAMDGFNYPVDVYYGNINLGTLEAKPDGFVIRFIDTPKGRQSIKQSASNKFKSLNLAAKVLHRTWQSLRSGDETGGVTVPA